MAKSEEHDFENSVNSKRKGNFDQTLSTFDSLTTGKMKTKDVTGLLDANKKTSRVKPAPFFQLFQMASASDTVLVIVALLCAIATGVCWPLQVAIFGELCNAFISFSLMSTHFNESFFEDSCHHKIDANVSLTQVIIDFTVKSGAFHIVLIIQTFIFVTCLNIAAENQSHRCRKALMKALLSQDISWYDQQVIEGLTTSFSENLRKFQEGLGEKLGILISSVSYVVSCFAVALYHGWELSLIAMAVLPILTVSSGALGKIQSTMSAKETVAYAAAGGMVEEIVGAIKTVVMFGAQDAEIERFQSLLKPARRAGIKRGLAVAIGSSFVWIMTYCCYGLTFWYGIYLILGSCGQEYDAGSMNVIFFCLLMAAMKMGQIFPLWDTLTQTAIAASEIFKIIHQTSIIESSTGVKPENMKGNIAFEKVEFAYPARPDVPVLHSITFQVKAGETVALVGQSGCGKSTCIQLLQRFYDPTNGRLTIDGHNVNALNLHWLRNQIGVVGQEPVLFNGSIRDNIRWGCPVGMNVTQQDIELAATQANAHRFIMKLPRGYETNVGERGAQLSGGQKQRIAIARALIRRPKILLFDEATSALDAQSESAVQKALDEASKGRTTIIVAHRLSTIRNADRILVVNNGVVEEEGDHKTLMEKKGLYYQLVESQEHYPPSALNSKSPAEDKQIERDERQTLNEVGGSIIEDGEIPCIKNDTSLWEILTWNTPEWHYIALGVIGSAMVGLSTPIYAINYGELMGLLSEPDKGNVSADIDFYSLMFVVVAVTTGIGAFLQNFMLSIAGEKLTYRLRVESFKAMMRQKMEWFDLPANSVGSLCSRLSNDASAVQGATGARLGVIFQVITGIVFGLVISFFCSWKLALANGFFAPLIMLSGFIGVKISIGDDSVKTKALEQSAAIATEAISNIRTVKSLSREETLCEKYASLLDEPHSAFLRRAPLRGLVYALTVYGSSTVSVFSFAYGGYLVRYEGLEYKQVFKITEALIFGMEMIGQAMAFTPDYGRAKSAAVRISSLIKHVLVDDASGGDVKTMDGSVEFEDVHFRYKMRPDVPVLKGVNFAAPTGQTIALVGHSGCGKSTCVQLLQRLYEPNTGVIRVDEVNISSLSVGGYRSFIGVVSQEPVLFNRTIAENIAYGDLNRQVPMSEIIEAAVKANIHSFVSSLPLGYDTRVGQRGVQLSGGQKQRVAIARVLIRNPKLLILDEATSALDAESERSVQEALDRAEEGRTCVVIAHRLSTIKGANSILVIDQGEVIEQGTHDDLVRSMGFYYQLLSSQGEQQEITVL